MATGGEILIDQLLRFGATHAFCVPGESYLGALDAIHDRQHSFNMITCRQEGGAAYMADAWGKLHGAPGICFVSRGPGSSNAMVGIHTSFQDSTPMLCMVGQISRGDRGRRAFQEIDYLSVYQGVAKQVIVIDQADRVAEQIRHAWLSAVSGRPGPVIVVLYEDMLMDDLDGDALDLLAEDIGQRYMAAPPNEAILQVAKRLHDANQPLVICGDSMWNCHTKALLERLSNTWALPVTTAFRRQDSFDNTHPYYVGEFGLVAPPDTSDRLMSADLLLVLGPQLGDITTRGYQFPHPHQPVAGQHLIHVHREAELPGSVFYAHTAIQSDCTEFLERLLDNVDTDTAEVPEQRRMETIALNKGYRKFTLAPRDTGDKVRMDKVMAFLRERLPANSIIANGAGNYTTWPQRHYQFTMASTQLAPTNGSMGYGVPAAVAAALARPDEIIVSFSGDGCFMMNGQELATAVQYGLNIVFLVLNNNAYGTIRIHQEKHYPGRPIATTLQNPDFAALARAYGAAGFTVDSTEEFANTFENALSTTGPSLIEIQLD